MRKLTLQLDALRVESFTPREGDAAARGTIRAESYVTFFYETGACCDPSMNCPETDVRLNTCGNSCIYECRPTGNDPACYD
jgi:hypothetical protein